MHTGPAAVAADVVSQGHDGTVVATVGIITRVGDHPDLVFIGAGAPKRMSGAAGGGNRRSSIASARHGGDGR